MATKKVEAKERTDNPLTDHSDEPASIDVVTTKEKPAEEGTETVVSTEPPEKDDDEPGEGVWKQKKRERREQYSAMEQRAAEAERRAMEAEQRAAVYAAHLQVAGEQAKRPASDPLDDEQKQIEADWKRHMELAKVIKDPDQIQQWQSDYLKIMTRNQAVVTKREMREQQRQQGQSNPGEEYIVQHLHAKYPAVMRDQYAKAHAEGLLRARMAQKRQWPPMLEDYEAVVQESARAFRLPGAPSASPSQATRQKFSGNGLTGSHAGVSRGEGKIAMNDQMKAMAEAAYTKERDPKTGQWRRLSKEEAHAKWAQGPGKRLAEKL